MLFLVFTIWRTKRAFSSIGDWHQINAHAGKAKQALPATIYMGPGMWGLVMIACAMALVIHGTMVYYADESYDTFSQMVPVYPAVQPVENGFGISSSIDKKLLIVEYVVSDSWETVAAYYAGKSIPGEWRHYSRTGEANHICLEHQNGNTVFISLSEPARYKKKGLRILEYTLFRKDLK